MTEKKDKDEGFFKWLFKKWYFWVLSLGWGFWSGIEELKAHNISEFLGNLLASFVIVIFIFGIVYLINKSISRKVKEEIKSKK